MNAAERFARAVGDQWSRFWFTPAPASTLTFFRVALGLTTLAWSLSMSQDLIAFYGESGLKPDPFYADHRIGLFQWFESNTAVYLLYAVMVASSVSLIVGRGVRLSAPLLWVAVMSFQFDNTNVLNAGDELLRLWTLYYAIFAVLTPSRFLDVPLFGRPGPDGRRVYPIAPTWLIRLAQLQLTVIYPFSVIAKFEGSSWLEGTATIRALGLVDFERFWLPDIVRESVAIAAVMTWSTLAIELALPFLLWTRRTRRFGILLGVGLHVGFDYSMRLGFFGWVMLIGYVAMLTPSESSRLLGWLRFGRRGRPADAPTSQPVPT